MFFGFNYEKLKNFMAWEFHIYNNMIVKQLSLNSKKSQYKKENISVSSYFIKYTVSTTWYIIASLINEALPILFYKSHSYVRMRFIQYEHTFWLYSLEINEVWQKRKLRLSIFYYKVKIEDHDMIFTIYLLVFVYVENIWKKKNIWLGTFIACFIIIY